MFTTSRDMLPECIGFLLVPNFSMIAFSSAVEPLRVANRLAGQSLYSWQILSQGGTPVTASNGISVNADFPIDIATTHPNIYSSVVVCSGLGAEHYDNREVFAWLRRTARSVDEIGAVCTGAHILAAAGLLHGYKCTIHWENLPGFSESFPDIEVATHLFEIDRNRFTCSGGTASFDMMLYLIAREHGDELAAKVSEQCLLDRIRCADNQQRAPLNMRLGRHHPKLISVIEVMESHLEDPLSPDQLSAVVGLSRRHLERLFRKYLGVTPSQFYTSLRLERAYYLLQQTNMSVLAVAQACGFVSASHFSKAYREHYRHTPRTERAGQTISSANGAALPTVEVNRLTETS